MNDIGSRIRQRREELGMSQEELAKKVGYTSRSTINKIENGANNIRQPMVNKIASALDVPPSWLLGYEKSIGEISIDIIEKNMESLDAQRLERIRAYADYLIKRNSDES